MRLGREVDERVVRALQHRMLARRQVVERRVLDR